MQLKEQQHDDRGLPQVDTTLQDLRYALRVAQAGIPASPLAAVLTLGHRHRRDHDDVQRRARGAAAPAAVQRSPIGSCASSRTTR